MKYRPNPDIIPVYSLIPITECFTLLESAKKWVDENPDKALKSLKQHQNKRDETRLKKQWRKEVLMIEEKNRRFYKQNRWLFR
jgi:hypothetical protein